MSGPLFFHALRRRGDAPQPQGEQRLGSAAEKFLLPVHNGLGAAPQGGVPLVQGPEHPLRLAQLAGEVLLYLPVLRLLEQPPVVAADLEGGALPAPETGDEPALLGLLHEDIGQNILDLVRLFKDRPRPGLQLPDQGLRPAHLLHVDGQLGGDGPVVPLGQGVQVVLDDGQGGAGLMDAAQLELQALGQVSRPHPRGLQGAQQLDAPLDFLHGDRQVPGQVLRAGAQIAVPVQAQA